MLKKLCRIVGVLSDFAFGFFEICAEYRAKDYRQSCKPLASVKKLVGAEDFVFLYPKYASDVGCLHSELCSFSVLTEGVLAICGRLVTNLP